MIWALTGGIATGKSQALSDLEALVPSLTFFDCDSCVHKLYEFVGVQKQIELQLGRSFSNNSGDFDKAALREFVFAQSEARKTLESVFHPLVRKELLAELAIFANNKKSALFVADVPLLFENGFDFGQDVNVVVATSRTTQKSRLKIRNQFEDTLMEKILHSQWPIERKIECADHVLWNEGPREILRNQLKKLIAHYQLL